MTIHTSHPFLEPPEQREAARRFRARLGGAVSLWTSGQGEGPRDRAGLTVSSIMVAPGDPAEVIGLLNPDFALFERLTETRRAVVQLLPAGSNQLADAFAGVAPAPGGAFRLADWQSTDWGPRLARASIWSGVELIGEPTECGWFFLVRCAMAHVEVVDAELLGHLRGRYHSL